MKSTGFHIISDLQNCRCDNKYLLDYKSVKKFINDLIVANKLTVVKTCFYSFGKDQGWTGMFLLAESHISLHTWPDLNNDKKFTNKIQLDIFVCNYKCDNSKKALYIYKNIDEFFKPKIANVQIINRK